MRKDGAGPYRACWVTLKALGHSGEAFFCNSAWKAERAVDAHLKPCGTTWGLAADITLTVMTFWNSVLAPLLPG